MCKHSKFLGVMLVLQGLILAGQWAGNGYLTSAQAQIADPGRDRLQMLDETRKTNDKLDKLIEILRSGDLQVRVVQPDENKAKPAAR